MFLLIGDPHFKTTNAYECDQFINEVYKLVEKENYQKIIILGDILDTHERINLTILCKATDFIVKLSQKTNVYVLIGNHDRINNSIFLTEEHAFAGLKNKKNIKIIDKVLYEEDILYVPYVPTGRFEEAIKTVDIDINKCKIIFAHQEFKNSIMKDQGDEIPEKIPIYSGHIHNYRKLKNVTYIGTPFQHSYYDDPNKFIMEIELKDKKIKENKIYLDIIKKRIQELTISELQDYKIDEKYMTKINIKGEYKLLKNKKIQEILNHSQINYKILPRVNDKEYIEENNKDFKFFLEKKLESEKKEIKNLYEKIIKKINDT